MKIKEVSLFLNRTTRQITRYREDGKITAIKGKSGHWIYNSESVAEFKKSIDTFKGTEKFPLVKKWVVYIRVSSGNKDDILSQKKKALKWVQRIRRIENSAFKIVIIVEGCQEGNENRPKWRRLISKVIQKKYHTIFIWDPTRIAIGNPAIYRPIIEESGCFLRIHSEETPGSQDVYPDERDWEGYTKAKKWIGRHNKGTTSKRDYAAEAERIIIPVREKIAQYLNSEEREKAGQLSAWFEAYKKGNRHPSVRQALCIHLGVKNIP